MIPRRLLTTLVFALPVLIVAFGVILGAAELAKALGDTAGARGLFWIAIAALILLLIDALLLLGVLGLQALDEPRDHDGA
jgi:hypothetical protein